MINTPTPPAPFTKGDRVCIVHFGADPTYADVACPEFVIAEDVEILRWDTGKGKCRFRHGNKIGSHTNIEWFINRMFIKSDALRRNEIIEAMAHEQCCRNTSFANPKVWLAGSSEAEPEASSRYARVARQYAVGDYRITTMEANSEV